MKQEWLGHLEAIKKTIRTRTESLLEDIKIEDKKKYDVVCSTIKARAETACEIIDTIRFTLEARV